MKKIINKNLTKYLNYLKKRNLAFGTIKLHSIVLLKYKSLNFDTNNIQKLFSQFIIKDEVNYLKTKMQIFRTYCRFQKLKIDWDKISRIIPKLQPNFFDTINEDELAKLKQARFEESNEIYQRNNLAIDFLFYTGVRVGELVNIRHSDYQNNSLRIHGKGNKVRFVFLPKFLINKISPYSHDYLFISKYGNPFVREWIIWIIKQRTILAGIKKKITPHTFRRSFATILNNKGARMSTIQKLLGHSNINTTLGYIHNDYETLYADYSKLWKNEPQILTN